MWCKCKQQCQTTSVSSLITIFVSETVMKAWACDMDRDLWFISHFPCRQIDRNCVVSCVFPFYTHIFLLKEKNMTARAEARSVARAEAFQPGHLTWRALASRRHCCVGLFVEIVVRVSYAVQCFVCSMKVCRQLRQQQRQWRAETIGTEKVGVKALQARASV